MEQFKTASREYDTIDRIIDGDPRQGYPSTGVRVVGDTVEIIRAGAIAAGAILQVRE